MCAKQSGNVGTLIFDKSDIKPKSIVFELEHFGMACGPVGHTNVYLSKDLIGVCDICEMVLNEFILHGLIDAEAYKEYIRKEMKSVRLNTGKQDLIKEWTKELRAKMQDIKIKNMSKSGKDELKEVKKVIGKYNLSSCVGRVAFLKDYINDKKIQKALVETLEYLKDHDEWEEKNEVQEYKGSRLVLNRDKSLIAIALSQYDAYQLGI